MLGHKDAERAFGANAPALPGKKFIAKQCLFNCDLPVGGVAEGCFAFKDRETLRSGGLEGSSAHVQYYTPELCCFPPTMHSCGSVVKQPPSLLIPLEQLMHM